MQNRDGRVTKRDFRRVLESFCFRMSQQQFHELMAMIDPYNKGYVSYLEFLDRFEQRETKVIYSAVVFSKRPDGPALLNEISLPTLPPWRLKCQPHPLSPGLREKTGRTQILFPQAHFIFVRVYHLLRRWLSWVLSLNLGKRAWQVTCPTGKVLTRSDFVRALRIEEFQSHNPGQKVLGQVFFTWYILEFAANQQYTLIKTALRRFPLWFTLCERFLKHPMFINHLQCSSYLDRKGRTLAVPKSRGCSNLL